MQIKPEQLAQHLDRGLAQCYLVSGDEPLLIQEAADAIRRASRNGGCTEREVIDIKQGSDWQNLLQSAGAMSLFADRKLIEVRLPSGKPGTDGSKALQEYLDLGGDDILLVVTGKIDKSSQRAKWYTRLDQAGVIVPIWPIDARNLPAWLERRLEAAGLRADREALQLLAERIEGNLLAAVQEVEKLKLLADDGTVTTDTVIASVLDNARYNVFGLADAALSGDARSALRSLRGLEAEATAPPQVLWALARDIRLLIQLADDRAQGISADRAMNQRGVWRSRWATVQGALERHNQRSLRRLQSLVFSAESSIKGFGPGRPWDFLDRIVILLARGVQRPSSSARRA